MSAPNSALSGPVLALDCTLSGLSIGLQTAEKSYKHADAAPRAADALHPALQTLCRQAGITLNQVISIAVTTGPGSFTGIRLGLAVAQALKLVTPTLQIIGLPTLPLLARQFVAENPGAASQKFTVLLDAAGGMAYRQDFTRQDFHSNATPASPAVVEPLTDLSLPHPVYLPTGLILPFVLPATSHFFTMLNPTILLAAATDPTLHGPAAPTYLKPLNYRMTGTPA